MDYLGLDIKNFYDTPRWVVKSYCLNLDCRAMVYKKVKDNSYLKEESLKELKVEEIKEEFLCKHPIIEKIVRFIEKYFISFFVFLDVWAFKFFYCCKAIYLREEMEKMLEEKIDSLYKAAGVFENIYSYKPFSEKKDFLEKYYTNQGIFSDNIFVHIPKKDEKEYYDLRVSEVYEIIKRRVFFKKCPEFFAKIENFIKSMGGLFQEKPEEFEYENREDIEKDFNKAFDLVNTFFVIGLSMSKLFGSRVVEKKENGEPSDNELNDVLSSGTFYNEKICPVPYMDKSSEELKEIGNYEGDLLTFFNLLKDFKLTKHEDFYKNEICKILYSKQFQVCKDEIEAFKEKKFEEAVGYFKKEILGNKGIKEKWFFEKFWNFYKNENDKSFKSNMDDIGYLYEKFYFPGKKRIDVEKEVIKDLKERVFSKIK
jgi:hypothetical protein